jgi:ribokinase
VSARIVILGDIATDVVVELDGEPVPGSDVDATIRQVGGGAGGNVAVWCAAAGGDVVLVGRSGADAPGAERVTEIRAHGVTVHAATDPLLPTGTIVAVTTPTGSARCTPTAAPTSRSQPDDVSDAVLAGAAHLHVSGYALLHPAPRPAARSVLTRARDRGLTTSVDLSSAAPLAAAGAAAFRAWTQDVDLCRGNRVEAEVLSGAAGAAAACRDLATAYAIAVVTDGRQGIWAASAGTVLHVPAVPQPSSTPSVRGTPSPRDCCTRSSPRAGGAAGPHRRTPPCWSEHARTAPPWPRKPSPWRVDGPHPSARRRARRRGDRCAGSARPAGCPSSSRA